MCSRLEFPLLTDAVESRRQEPNAQQSNQEGCNSTQRCANYWFPESKLRRGTLKILFQQYRPKADIKEIRQRGTPNTRLCARSISLAFSNFRF
jgi:hypothetical protein